MTLVWETPPKRRPSRISWQREAHELRTRPTHWARLTERTTSHSARSMVYQINSGALVAFQPAGDFEACARDNVVWARYLGDGA